MQRWRMHCIIDSNAIIFDNVYFGNHECEPHAHISAMHIFHITLQCPRLKYEFVYKLYSASLSDVGSYGLIYTL